MAAFGEIRTVTYIDTDLREVDNFRVVFASGQAVRFRIGLDADGRIITAVFQPEAPAAAR